MLGKMGQNCPKITGFEFNVDIIWATLSNLSLCVQTREDYNARIVRGKVCKKSKYLQNDLHTFTIAKFMCSMKATKFLVNLPN